MTKTRIDYSSKLIRIDGIAAMLYRGVRPSKTIVVYGLGAPVVPDNGTLLEAKAMVSFDTDVLVPDYIGFGRSDGILTPMSCIQTFLILYNQLIHRCVGRNAYENSQTPLHYHQIIFLGRSFGGTYVPLLPRFNANIRELGLIFPAVDNQSSGSIPGEESNQDFLRSMKEDGYHHLYRGIFRKEWIKHLNNKDGLSPMDNIEYLAHAKLFIGHGKQDSCIHYSKSLRYFQNIIKRFPKGKQRFILKLYEKGAHNSETAQIASLDFLRWLHIPRREKRL